MQIGKANRVAALVLSSLVGGCASDDTPGGVFSAEFSEDLERTNVESLEELAKRTAIPGEEDRYLVEGDMALSYEALQQYYENRSFQNKSTVTVARHNATGVNYYAIRTSAVGTPAMNLRYCLTGGWGGSQANQAAVEAALVAGATAWEGVAAVRFIHVTSADGAGCTQGIVGSTVDFVVKPNVGSPNSAYAWWRYATVSELAVGQNMAYDAAMIHELGHILGFDHEFYHDGSGLTGTGCLTAGTAPPYSAPIAGYSWVNQADLTSYDNQSIMGYYNGTTPDCASGTPVGRLLSSLDGVGARAMYGAPWFWPVPIANGILN